MLKSYLFIISSFFMAYSSGLRSEATDCNNVLPLEVAVEKLKNVTVLNEYQLEEYFQPYRVECSSRADAILGILYYQFLENLRDKDKSIALLQKSALKDDVMALAYLGALYLEDAKYKNIQDGIAFLEKASAKGDTVAMRNLYVASTRGFYNRQEGQKWLLNAVSAGNEVAALLYAQLLRTKAEQEKNYHYLFEAIKHLKTFNFDQLVKERDYSLANILLNPKTPYFNTEEGLTLLEQAAGAGHQRAIQEWAAYKAWLEQN